MSTDPLDQGPLTADECCADHSNTPAGAETAAGQAPNHRVGTRRDQEIGELKARLDRVENELYLSRQVAKMAANGARSLRLLASKLHGDVRTLSTSLDERLRTLESGLNGTRDAGK